MEILGKVWDITLKKGEEDAKIKIRVVEGDINSKHQITDKIEVIVNKEGKIIVQ